MKRFLISMAITLAMVVPAIGIYAATPHCGQKATSCPMMKSAATKSCTMQKDCTTCKECKDGCKTCAGCKDGCKTCKQCASSTNGAVKSTGSCCKKQVPKTAPKIAKKIVSAICPVMGSKIPDVSKAAGKSVYKGKTYYFCCSGCKPAFDKNPSKYAK